jgi:hypothetical protein
MTYSKFKVIVYGNSLLLAGVANLLQDQPGLELAHIPSSPVELLLIQPPYPDVVIFDLNSIEAKRIIQLLIKEDKIRLLGIDFYRGVAVEYQKSKNPVQSSLDLINLVIGQ